MLAITHGDLRDRSNRRKVTALPLSRDFAVQSVTKPTIADHNRHRQFGSLPQCQLPLPPPVAPLPHSQPPPATPPSAWIRLFLASSPTRQACISSAGYGTSSSAGSGPGFSRRRAASVARTIGIWLCPVAANHNRDGRRAERPSASTVRLVEYVPREPSAS